MYVQKNINIFESDAMAGCGSYAKIEGFAFLPVTCFAMALSTFVSQNLGANQPDRVKKVIHYALLQTAITVIVVASTELLLADVLINLYLDGANADNAAIVAYAKEIMFVMLTSYIIFGVVDSMQSGMRGLGRSLTPTLITLFCICGIRVSWILCIAPTIKTVWGLYLGFPISWVIGGTVSVILFLRIFRAFKNRVDSESEQGTEVPA